jgi:GNAT superfamily N-acetyltransferase
MLYVVHQGSDLKPLTSQLIHQEVFEESGHLQDVWERIQRTGKNSGRKCLIVVAVEPYKSTWSTMPSYTIRGALVYDINRSHINVYVKPKWRRKGVATRLLERLRDFENYDRRVISAEPGYPGSEHWFEKNLVYIPDYTFSEAELQKVNGELQRAGKITRPLPWLGDAVAEIMRRRKRAFLQLVLKAQKEGRI